MRSFPVHRRFFARRHLLVALACGAAALTASRGVAQAPLSLVVIVHPQVPVQTLSEAELAAIFTGTMRTWSDGTSIRLFNMPVQTDPRVEFDKVVLKMSSEQNTRFWLDKRIRGEGIAPRQVPSAELLMRLTATMPGTITYVPEEKLGKGVRVIARVRGGKVVLP